MTKRPTLKGRGADIFFEKGKKESLQEKKIYTPIRKEKATFYLSSSILRSLDSIWLSFRKEDRKIKKSALVEAALKQAVEDFGKNKKESALSKHFTSTP